MMKPDTALLNVRQMGEADRLSVEAGIPVFELMDRAGKAIALAIEQRFSACRVLVLCGPGNNGGDGFAAARYLAGHGWPVRVALLGGRDRLTGAAHVHAQLWTGLVDPLIPSVLSSAELVVDAIFGAGLSRPVEGAAAETLAACAGLGLPVVAVDVPSGVLGDTGDDLGATAAVLTVTFFRKKPGHLLMPGRLRCGEVVVADIGTPVSVLEQIVPDTFENDSALWLAELPRPQLGGHKYTRGHALISGGYPVTGAARLAARGAARAGAGLTTIAVPEVALPIYAAALTSIMVHPLKIPSDFQNLLEDHRFTALLIGPGAGIGGATRTRVLEMLGSGRPVVLDADALTSFAEDRESLFRAITGACLLTPHDGEFRRLFDADADKLTRARRAAQLSGAIIILKGTDTVIASPDGRAVINANAPATLATGGSGDVLSGIVLGLLAQGMEPFLAAAAAVWLHGEAATGFGPGLIAEDLPDLLPGVLRRLQSQGGP